MILIMQGLLEGILTELLLFEEDPLAVKMLCDITGSLLADKSGKKYAREAGSNLFD